jgi:hypothetical protein
MWKDRCASAHAPTTDSSDKSSVALDRQHNTAWKWHTHTSPLASTRSAYFRYPPEERLQSRTSDIVDLAKTMVPVIHHRISEARTQHRTGHQDIRTSFAATAAPERTMNATLTTATVSALVHPQFPSDFSRQDPKPLRLQPTFSGPDITTSVLISLTRQRQNQPRTRRTQPRQKRPLPHISPLRTLRNRLSKLEHS